MILFDSTDPFPLVNGVSYEDEKRHASQVDAWLGFQTDAIERKLLNQSSVAMSHELWIGKSVQTFSTPYTELRTILEALKPGPGDTIVDLGAGYGRLAHVLARHFPESYFVGYELVRERHDEGERVRLNAGVRNAKFICDDVTRLDFSVDPAWCYFLYDFGSRQDVEAAVENLKQAARVRPITVVARGGRSRDIIEKLHPWLAQVVKPIHQRHYSIYRSAE